ncbi:diacylglycerol/lipid kinase family protein [Rhodococcus sp. SGAir0479]|uniref:diacylglycerol/lipid kinase family protein n=1 Tax=Rhodococcus sp. SGAir0479 TaxID=2567884 RepID=UPI0010CCFA6E|nr:diacylglycerol kinase family protein [Rhodococcus sp. SGAir0479]QCQ91975.1 diacylglycerol kinase family lipid kinase [Rhodococcus sp. SGAir0479]
MRALLIVNPNATSTTPAGRDLLAHALSSRVRLTVAHTTHRGHAAELAAQARADSIALIIVHGGDGTVNEVVNGLLGEPHPKSMRTVPAGPIPLVAVVPGGSANVFARSLGIAPDPVDATNQLIDLLALRRRRTIGLGHCDNRWFTFNAGMGLDAQVCEAVDTGRSNGQAVTPGRYVRHAVRAFFRARREDPTLTVHVPGHDPVDGVHYAFVSNSTPWTYLNRREVHTNPGTSFETGLGLFAMRTMRVLPSLRVVRQLLAAGLSPKSHSLIRFDDVSHIRIRATAPIGLQMDGDYIGVRSDVTFTAVADALTVVAPPAH